MHESASSIGASTYEDSDLELILFNLSVHTSCKRGVQSDEICISFHFVIGMTQRRDTARARPTPMKGAGSSMHLRHLPSHLHG